MFVNFSNHSQSFWDEKQTEAARRYGDIVDIPFPRVVADKDEKYITDLAEEYTNQIISLNPDCVMCQGEFTLTYAVVTALLKRGIKVVAACSERSIKENRQDGIMKKEVEYKFVKFREYRLKKG